jgi:hypothetical protein
VFTVTTACFFPNELWITTVKSVIPPAVDIWLSANLTLAEYPPPMFTWMDSALDILMTRSTRLLASSRERIAPSGTSINRTG